LTAVGIATKAGRAGLVTNGGTRGFTEILFAYASCMANNGQSMAGLNANSLFYNVTTAIAMLVGRFGLASVSASPGGAIRSPATLAHDGGDVAQRFRRVRSLASQYDLVGGGAVLPARLGPRPDRRGVPPLSPASETMSSGYLAFGVFESAYFNNCGTEEGPLSGIAATDSQCHPRDGCSLTNSRLTPISRSTALPT
jgi:hypothetical protein